jgi:UDP-N-acetylglucosamine:LPS N-acetylglucosamine transferase
MGGKLRVKTRGKKLCLACSSGGHLTQMLQLEPLYQRYDCFFITEDSVLLGELSLARRVYRVTLANRRMRLFPLILLKNSFRVLRILRKERPDVVVSTGALNAVPVCYLAKLLGSRIVFIESFAKLSEPSLSGRLVSPIADLFIVQWESMLRYYRKAVYGGSLY